MIHVFCAGTSSSELDSLISAQPRTKEDFIKLSGNIIECIIKRHQNKPLYAMFVEQLVRDLAMPLRDVEVRKAASTLTMLANEKQKEQREKASGKKKPKAVAKPALGAAKLSGKYVLSFILSIKFRCTLLIQPSRGLLRRIDTRAYEEALDDIPDDPNDFM